MKIEVENSIAIEQTPRLLQLNGIFDLPPSQRSAQKWVAQLPIEERAWNIGLIVGPSGCGKSTIARAGWGSSMLNQIWSDSRSIVDDFPAAMSIKEITTLLGSVGFSSPPSWVRPFKALSNGEQFRVSLARTIAESGDLAIVDEFTSVVDRTVAQIGSAAIAKAVRRRSSKFIAITCHEDVEPWLQPDWVYQPHLNRFQWRELQPRPEIELVINRVHSSAWSIFSKHHYLTAEMASSSICFVGFWRGRPVCIDAYLPFVGRLKDDRLAMRGTRTVCLPDYQGIGIGTSMISFLAGMWKARGYRVFQTSSHPALIHDKTKSNLWRLTRVPSMTPRGKHQADIHRASARLTASFEYEGPAMERKLAERLMQSWARG